MTKCAAGERCTRSGTISRTPGSGRIYRMGGLEFCCTTCVGVRDVHRNQLIEAYGGGEAAESLAECELRFRVAKCAHLLCDEDTYQDGGAQWCGIPLCPKHEYLGCSLVEAEDVRRHLHEARDHISRAQGKLRAAQATLAATLLIVLANFAIAWWLR